MAQFKVRIPPKNEKDMKAEDFFQPGDHPSMSASIFIWRRILGAQGFNEYEVESPCSICNSMGEVKTAKYGHVRCICQLRNPRVIEDQLERLSHQSRMTKKDLSAIEIWGSEAQKKEITNLLDSFQHFELYGDSWMTVIGKPGVGKSHCAQWLAQQLHPWALYISSTQFENGIFDNLDDNRLNEFKEAMKSTPVLIFDDLGAAYGSKFGVAGLNDVIDYRWNEARQFPTVITTNLSRVSVAQISQRIADRIFDVHTSRIIEMPTCLSWRTSHE